MVIVSGVVLKLYGLNFIDEVFKKVLEKVIEDNRSANPFVIAERNNIAIIYSVLPEKVLGRTLVHDEVKIIIMNDRIKKTQERYAVVTYLLYQILAKKVYTTFTITNDAYHFAERLLEIFYTEELNYTSVDFKRLKANYVHKIVSSIQ